MAYSDEQWRDVRILFESGVSLADIVAHKDVKIKSKGSISKKSNAEGWKVNERKHLVQKEVLATQELQAIKRQKETLTTPERSIHDALVSEQLKTLQEQEEPKPQQQQNTNINQSFILL